MLTLPDSTTSTSRTGRSIRWSLLPFRTIAALVAFTFFVLFEEGRKLLNPWIPYVEADAYDFGWDRHAELFLVPDTAAVLFQFALGVAALILIVRPLGLSGLVSWLAAGLFMISWGPLFTVLWAGASLVEMTITTILMIAVLCAPLVLFHPQRKAIIRGGLQANGVGPGKILRIEMAVIGLAGAGLAIGSALWRASGGVFENPREDSVLSLVFFGLVLALGALLCWRGREGWKTLAYMLNGILAYALIALLTYASS